MTTTTAYCESVPAGVLHAEIARLGVDHLLIVPDTHQKTLLASLKDDPAFKMHTFSTEDEAICVNSGLWMGGSEALVIIQNVGLFAAMNALRGVSIDMHVPTCMLVGQYARNVNLPVEDDPSSGCRLIQRMLASIDVPCYVIDRVDDVGLLSKAFQQSRDDRGPVVVLVSAPTS
jgi:sulfopyruvate decarboxylase TPP-binding subunit